MESQTVHLGYELGTGARVEIPVRHLCVAGQTQEAGKTTALEALLSRSKGMRSIAFLTKRGEGAFAHAKTIGPYFREQADWQFVASILEASRGEKMRFERAWIIRASKGAKTLLDVQHNVRRLMRKSKGMSADVYLTLDAYLDVVVPSIENIQFAKTVALGPGLSVMDLREIPLEMQHLVIKSTLDWVLQHAANTIVVIPEAWKFIPQGRGTPVKLAAESFIRQAAGLKNYLWLDSQDIGGIDKTILRSVPVWLLGVQREANEIKRTLENLPATTPRVTASSIQQLKIGQFFACWGTHAVKTYVQPIWLDDLAARDVALARSTYARPLWMAPLEPDLAPADSSYSVVAEVQGDDEMNPAQEKKLDTLVEVVHKLVNSIQTLATTKPTIEKLPPVEPSLPDMETLYQSFKQRLVDELPTSPELLTLLVQRPELRVKVERKVLDVDGSTPEGRIGLLISEGFFDDPKAGNAVYLELRRRGVSLAKPTAYLWCDKMTTRGFLTNEKDGYRVASDVKVTTLETTMANVGV